MSLTPLSVKLHMITHRLNQSQMAQHLGIEASKFNKWLHGKLALPGLSQEPAVRAFLDNHIGLDVLGPRGKEVASIDATSAAGSLMLAKIAEDAIAGTKSATRRWAAHRLAARQFIAAGSNYDCEELVEGKKVASMSVDMHLLAKASEHYQALLSFKGAGIVADRVWYIVEKMVEMNCLAIEMLKEKSHCDAAGSRMSASSPALAGYMRLVGEVAGMYQEDVARRNAEAAAQFEALDDVDPADVTVRLILTYSYMAIAEIAVEAMEFNVARTALSDAIEALGAEYDDLLRDAFIEGAWEHNTETFKAHFSSKRNTNAYK